MEAQSRARSAEKRSDTTSEAVLGGVTPAVEGLQESVGKIHDWSGEVTTNLRKLSKEIVDLKQEVAYLRGYVEFDSRGRYKPKPEEVKVALDKPEPPPVPLQTRPAIKIPNTVKDAREQMAGR